MSLPNENVVNAIIESYLKSKKNWNLESQDGKVTLPANDTEIARKLDICLKILQKANAVYLTTTEWIELIQFLHEMELKEQTELDKRGFVRTKFGTIRLLETVQAVRSYILETMQNNVLYLDRIKPLLDDKTKKTTDHTNSVVQKFRPEQVAKAKAAMDAACKAYEPYDLEQLMLDKRDHHTYFATYIAQIVGPKEATFEDFEKNVIKKSVESKDDNSIHKGKLGKKILEEKRHKAAIEAKATVAANKPVVEEAPKAPAVQPKAAEQPKAPEMVVVKTAVAKPAPAQTAIVSVQPTPAQPMLDFFSQGDFDFMSMNLAELAKPASTTSSISKPGKPAPAPAPVPEPRRSTRKHTQETKSSALQDNSAFKQPVKSTITTRSHDKSSKKGSDPYDWGDYPATKTSSRTRGY